MNAKKIKTLFNKANGINNVKFTHSNEAIIWSSNKEPYEIFYWSIHENEIIKVFQAHKSEVISINLNPSDDTFVSISKDGDLKIYDLAADHQSPEAELSLGGQGYSLAANFDVTGVVLAVSVFKKDENDKPINKLDLYDVKKYKDEDCRFESWRLDQVPQITMIKFSNNTAYILVSTVENKVVILDAFE